MEITGETLIEDLVREHPESVTVLEEFGIRCLRCGEPIWGTLEEAAREKGIEDLTPVLERLRAARTPSSPTARSTRLPPSDRS